MNHIERRNAIIVVKLDISLTNEKSPNRKEEIIDLVSMISIRNTILIEIEVEVKASVEAIAETATVKGSHTSNLTLGKNIKEKNKVQIVKENFLLQVRRTKYKQQLILHIYYYKLKLMYSILFSLNFL